MNPAAGAGRRQLWWLALLGVSLFAVWSLLGVVADVAAFRGKAWVETWAHQAVQARSKGQVFFPQDANWEEAHAFAALSVKLSPFNADYREGLARIHEARWLMAAPGLPEATADRMQAASLYREAIVLRPTWPYAHAALVYALARVGGHEAEVEASMLEAARLGPWEPQVMDAIIDVGLDGWYRLTPTARQVVSETILRSQSWRAGAIGERHADRSWAIIRQHRKQALACAMLPQREERIRSRCDPATW
ncbi:MAG: hypothetical protein ACLGHE_01930 [Gammaproteobacteria bacterium]